jgi:hypothetical protein
VNGQRVENGIFGSNGVVYVPIRFVANVLGVPVQWEPLGNAVTLTLPGKIVILRVGSAAVEIRQYAQVDGSKFLVNTEQRVLDMAAALEYRGRAFVPLRFVADFLGVQIFWNGAQVSIVR